MKHASVQGKELYRSGNNLFYLGLRKDPTSDKYN